MTLADLIYTEGHKGKRKEGSLKPKATPLQRWASLFVKQASNGWSAPTFEQMQWIGTTPALYTKAKQRLENLQFPLTLYRAVKIRTEADLWPQHAGIYWTDKLENARFYTPAGKTAPGHKFVLRTQVDAHMIDWDSTFNANCEKQGHTGTREQEIKLHAGAPITINAILPPDATEFEPRQIHIQAKTAKKLEQGEGETLTDWDKVHIAAAEDDELADAIIEYVQANFQWSSRPDLRDRLLAILKKCPATTKTLYRAEEPSEGGSPENGQRGFRSWTVNHDTAVYLGKHMGHPNFVVRTTGGAPVKGLSINDFHYWHGRVHGYAGSGTAQAEYLVLDTSVPKRVWKTDVRWNTVTASAKCTDCGGPTNNCKCASFVHASQGFCCTCASKRKQAAFQFHEIEFLCVNSDHPLTTPTEDQHVALFKALRGRPGVYPYRQDGSDEAHTELSLAVILTDKTQRSWVLQQAKALGVPVDLEQMVSERKLNEIIRGEGEGQIPKTSGLTGFNVNDSELPWTQWILEGKKTIETRNSPSLNAHVGERIGMVRTGQGPATLVGYCVLGTPKVYRSNEEFRADDALHLVPQGSGFDIPAGGVKYGYPISNVEPCPPKRVDAQGRVWRRLASVGRKEEWWMDPSGEMTDVSGEGHQNGAADILGYYPVDEIDEEAPGGGILHDDWADTDFSAMAMAEGYGRVAFEGHEIVMGSAKITQRMLEGLQAAISTRPINSRDVVWIEEKAPQRAARISVDEFLAINRVNEVWRHKTASLFKRKALA